MEYKNLGNTGLKVSTLCLGTMTFGNEADWEASKEIYSLTRDRGINFFDCANVYVEGNSERILGKLIKEHREQVIVASKAFFPTSDDINGKGSSRFHLTKELDKSLKRLNTDYLDLYYLHSFDPETPLEESLSTLNDFVRQGKVLYIGLSNFAAWQVMKAVAVSTKFNYAPIACLQPMYNLLKRQCESEILPMAESEKIGIVPYSPIAGGLLSGKYLVDNNNEGRFDHNEMYQKRYEEKANNDAIKSFIQFAGENNFNPVSLAVAWVRSHPGVTAPIVGARNTDQLKPTLDSLEIKMTPELRNKISKLSLAPAIATDRSEEG